jgi:hypothetical protein
VVYALLPKAAAAVTDGRGSYGPIADVTFQFIRGRMVRQTKRQIAGAILPVPYHAPLVIGARIVIIPSFEPGLAAGDFFL